jgi:hypothetical protein
MVMMMMMMMKWAFAVLPRPSSSCHDIRNDLRQHLLRTGLRTSEIR